MLSDDRPRCKRFKNISSLKVIVVYKGKQRRVDSICGREEQNEFSGSLAADCLSRQLFRGYESVMSALRHVEGLKSGIWEPGVSRFVI